MSQAILEIFQRTSSMESVTLKYSITGHSYVQKVDNMHKEIEDAMRVTEFYFLVSLLRLLLKVNGNQPYGVTQMGRNDFRDFMDFSKMLHFNCNPYSKVNRLKFHTSILHRIEYKLSHNHNSFEIKNVGIVRSR